MSNASGVDRTRRRHRWFALVTLSIAVAASLILTEATLRVLSYDPLTREEVSIEIEPLGTTGTVDEIRGHTLAADMQLMRPDSILGYTHRPGEYLVELGDGYTFKMTHDEDALRITHPQSEDALFDDLPAIWVFGCSFTHGWSVDDEDTFAWKLQERFPGYNIVNFGVSGYGQVHALLQFQEALKTQPPPQLVILTYAHFHDERNTFGRAYRRATVMSMAPQMRGSPFPYAKLVEPDSATIERRPATYLGLPILRHSALATFVDAAFDGLDDRFTRSHDVSQALVLEFSRICKQHEIELVVAGLTQEPATWDMMAFCLQRGIRHVDISFDYGNPDYMNAPHDETHPSPAGHLIYAKRLAAYLENQGLVEPAETTVETNASLLGIR